MHRVQQYLPVVLRDAASRVRPVAVAVVRVLELRQRAAAAAVSVRRAVVPTAKWRDNVVVEVGRPNAVGHPG